MVVAAAVCMGVMGHLVSPSQPASEPSEKAARAPKLEADKKAKPDSEAADQKVLEKHDERDAMKKAEDERNAAEKKAEDERRVAAEATLKKAEDERKAAAEAALKKTEEERRRTLEAQGLPYYPLPNTLYKGKNAAEWAKYVKNSVSYTDEEIAALTALKEEGMPFLLDALNHATDPRLHTALLFGVKPEYIHKNDAPKLVDSLDKEWSKASRILALTHLSKIEASKIYYEVMAERVADIKSYSDVNGNVSELLDAIKGK